MPTGDEGFDVVRLRPSVGRHLAEQNQSEEITRRDRLSGPFADRPTGGRVPIADTGHGGPDFRESRGEAGGPRWRQRAEADFAVAIDQEAERERQADGKKIGIGNVRDRAGGGRAEQGVAADAVEIALEELTALRAAERRIVDDLPDDRETQQPIESVAFLSRARRDDRF